MLALELHGGEVTIVVLQTKAGYHTPFLIYGRFGRRNLDGDADFVSLDEYHVLIVTGAGGSIGGGGGGSGEVVLPSFVFGVQSNIR